MAQASRKVVAPEADLDEITLAAPRFDEAAAQQARPVVPLSDDAGYATVSHAAVHRARPSYLPASQGSWLIAAFVGLLLGAGAMALGVVAYRRNHTTVPARSLVPAVAAVMPELNQDFRARPSSRSSSAAQPTVAVESKPEAVENGPQAPVAAAAEPKRVKRRTVVTTAPPEHASSENNDSGRDSSGKPKPRLVDTYVVPSSRP
jgi:hypothetical protein